VTASAYQPFEPARRRPGRQAGLSGPGAPQASRLVVRVTRAGGATAAQKFYDTWPARLASPQPSAGPASRGARPASRWHRVLPDHPFSRWLARAALDGTGTPVSAAGAWDTRFIPVPLRAPRGAQIDAGTATGAPADLWDGRRTPWTGSRRRGPLRRPLPHRREHDER
jgi:hypothetical protein